MILGQDFGFTEAHQKNVNLMKLMNHVSPAWGASLRHSILK